MELNVTIRVYNMPVSRNTRKGFMVVRLVDAAMWYYGTYDEYNRAREVALELGNGLVVEVKEEV